MRGVKLTLAALAGLMLTACATPAWVKDGATQQDLVSASYECERDLSQRGPHLSGAGWVNNARFTERCMAAKGWREASD